MPYRARHLLRRPRHHRTAVVLAAATVTAASPAKALAYEVRPGDTLSDIAGRHGVSERALARVNRLRDPNLIVIGQTLRMPGGGGGGGGGSHTVTAGQTLSAVAARYGTTTEAIARANNLSNPNLIVIGQTLRIPSGGLGGSPAPAPAAPASDVGSLLHAEATAHGVEPALAEAVAWQESGWNQSARSSVGAIGVMQVMPGTARQVNQMTGHTLRVRNTRGNVHLGVMYLKMMLDRLGSTKKALAAYYSGPGNVSGRLEGYQRAYVRSVLALRDRFR